MRAGLRVPDGYVVLHGSALLDGSQATDGLGGVVAVRSSASTEDTADASAAGQHDSFLGVRGADAIARAVRACRESLWSERAVAYRRARGLTADPVMAVLVQRHVDADVAGVAFTGDTVRIEASWGLGESVVHGLVTPDSWTVPGDGITAHAVGDKRERVDLAPAGGTTRTPVAAGDRERPCLTGDGVHRVAAMARRVEEVLGAPVDVEWALAGDDLWVLQARPVTAALPTAHSALAAAPAAASVHGTLTGTPGSPGTATGPARVLRGPADFAQVRAGDVIVCRSTDPAWTPLFAVAAAIVTETGGVLSHAAIVAREHRIPAVLGVAGAMSTIPEERPVTVHGDRGTVVTPTAPISRGLSG